MAAILLFLIAQFHDGKAASRNFKQHFAACKPAKIRITSVQNHLLQSHYKKCMISKARPSAFI